MATHKAHATPTKDFFVRMITKDISLEDCILDLIDNCIDGARKVKHSQNASERVDDYSGFRATISFTAQGFVIEDNCGGITISEAIDYAFHFGRRANTPGDDEYSIGLYGIGMKRAIFKMGNRIDIHSSTADEAFRTAIDVNVWLARGATANSESSVQPDDWDFDMDDAPIRPGTGTRIEVAELYPGIATQFANPTFRNGLARIIGRDYAQFLQKGFEIIVNGTKVEGFSFTVREGADFKSVNLHYEDEVLGVEVDVIAGMAGAPPDDLQPTARGETDNYGWFVLCNDRVVIAADKSDQTVWGDEGFPGWHYQYNGFVGVVSFHSKNPRLLPWKTTKRDVDGSNPTYRRAIVKMKEATRAWIAYTQARRTDIEEAKRRESQAITAPLFTVARSQTLQVPQVRAATQISYSSIQYSKPTADIAKVKKLLGNSAMPNSRMGEKTFDYFLENESGD